MWSLLDVHGLEASAVAYYGNNLHHDPRTREAVHDHLRRCIDAAQRLGCPLVGTFIGRDVTLPVADWLTGLGLYLNYDPSHLVWLGIDPVEALRGHLDRVLHVQAKDVEVDAVARNRFGVFGRAVDRSPWASGWWRYRVPGLGEVDWRRIVDTLHEAGYDGVVSVEHEDPVWSGDPQRVQPGLVIAERTLRPLVVV